MGLVTDPDQFGIFGTLDPNVLHNPKSFEIEAIAIEVWHFCDLAKIQTGSKKIFAITFFPLIMQYQIMNFFFKLIPRGTVNP